MGFFDKVVGTISDVIDVGAPVLDFFYPGAGQVASSVGQTVGGDKKGFIEEINEGGNWVQNYIQPLGNIASGMGGGFGFNPASLGGSSMFGAGASGVLGSIIGNQAQQGYNSAGLGAYNTAIADAERQIAQNNYNNQLAEYTARSQYAQQAAAASQAAAAARNAAARQEEQNRLAASKKSRKVLRKTMKRTNKQYKPWQEAGLQVLPVHTNMTMNAGLLGQLLTDSLTQATTPTRSDGLASLLIGGK